MKYQIFPVTYFHSKVDDNEQIKKNLLPRIMDNSHKLEVPKGWFTNKIKTSFDSECLEKVFDSEYQSILISTYSNCFDDFFDDEYRLMIDQLWYNVYTNGEYQEEHDHVAKNLNFSHFSCIHFLSFDKTRHKPPGFYDPLDQVRHFSLEMRSNNIPEIYYPDVNEGDFLMFPTYLKHSVQASESTEDYPRVTISMNVKLLKYGEFETPNVY